MAKIVMLVVVRLGWAESSSWTRISTDNRNDAVSPRGEKMKKKKKKSTEPTGGQRPCVMTRAFSLLGADL